jgi:hypothetical protein
MAVERLDGLVDLLTEAYAEKEHLEYTMADDETRERMRGYFTDLRLPPLERARLGARGTIFGSRTVNRLFNRLEGEALAASFKPQRHEGDRIVVRVRVGGVYDELEAAIRRELGADRIPLDTSPAADSVGKRQA